METSLAQVLFREYIKRKLIVNWVRAQVLAEGVRRS